MKDDWVQAKMVVLVNFPTMFMTYLNSLDEKVYTECLFNKRGLLEDILCQFWWIHI